ncbi:MAG TPA: hypothetical protein VF710_19915 [Longimicrobium sp.]
MLFGIVASACQDLPTANDAAPPGAESSARWSVASAPKSESPYMCYLSMRISDDGPARYAYKHVRVDFPKPFIGDNGETAVLRYVWKNEGEEPVAAANCRVPRTPEAIAFMDRRLAVHGRRRRRDGGEKDDGTVSTMDYTDCWTNSRGERVCPIEGIIVSPPPYYQAPQPYDPYANEPCWASCAGGASQGYNDGLGYGWDPGTPPEPGPCATGNTFIDDPKLGEGFSEAWRASNADAALGDRKEQYGWIVKTESGYRIHSLGAGNVCGADFTMAEPPEGYDAVVGFIHTHPYTVGEFVPQCGADGRINNIGPYPGEPSSFDRTASEQLGAALGRGQPLAGIILDANGIRLFVGQDLAMDLSIARCGY